MNYVNSKSYVNYLSYVSYVSYVSYLSHADYMSYVGRLYKLYELRKLLIWVLYESLEITWNQLKSLELLLIKYFCFKNFFKKFLLIYL